MTSGRRLDELAEARLGLLELALEAVPLAHVADRAVGPGERPVLVEACDRDELGRDGLAVGAAQVDPAAQLLRSGRHARPTSRARRHRFDDSCTSDPEMLAEQLPWSAPGHPLHRVREERQPGVRPDRPDDVRRVLDEEPVALLGFGQAGEQRRVRDRDGRLVGEALEEVELLGAGSRADVPTRPRACR